MMEKSYSKGEMVTMIKVYGASDDLIEIEGEISEEFYADEKSYLAFSDGTLVSVDYDQDGIWRFNVLEKGMAIYNKSLPNLEKDEYTEVLTLQGNIRWVVYGKDKAIRKTREGQQRLI